MKIPSAQQNVNSFIDADSRFRSLSRIRHRALSWKLAVCVLLLAFLNTAFPAVTLGAVTSDSVPSGISVSEKQTASSGRVVGNKDTRRYHLPGMPYYDQVQAHHRVYFNSEQEAIDSGYYKAGTGKDFKKVSPEENKAVRKPEQPEVVAPAAQRNEKVLEPLSPDKTGNGNNAAKATVSEKQQTGSVSEAGITPAKGAVVGNSDTKRYHLPGMPYYDKVKAYHRVYFTSEQEAIESGYYKAGTGKDLTGSKKEPAAQPEKLRIVGNSDSKRYHLPGMPYYDKVKSYHRVYFTSEQEAIESGYYKAGTGPDLSQRRRQEVVVPLAGKEQKPSDVPVESIVETKKSPDQAAEQAKQPVPVPDASGQVPAALVVPKDDAPKESSVGSAPESVQPPVIKEKTAQEAAAETTAVTSVPGLEGFAAAQTGESPVKIEADNLSYDNERDVYAGEGNVVITYGEGVLTADRVEYDRKKHLATAMGGAFLKMAEDTLAGDKIVVNVEDKTGTAYNSKAFYARNHFYIRGDKIEKTGEASYRIEQPLATTCDGDNPDWQLAGSEMNVTVDGYGWVTNARLLTKGLPVAYTPLVAFPAKTTRQTGFLFPYLAYSRDKDGLDIEIPFFWAINQQMDATFYSRYMEKRGFKEGVEFRYAIGSKSFGTIYGDYMEDGRQVTETVGNTLTRDWQDMHRRWSYMINHQTTFDSQFYIRTDLRQVSDAWYFRDFNAHNYYRTNFDATEQDPFKRISFQGNEYLRSLESTARVFKGWNNFNVMARVSSVEDFSVIADKGTALERITDNNNATLQKYPEIILTGIKQPLFSTPAYVEFTGTYDYFYREEGSKGHYLDVAPSISVPLAISNYLKITPTLSVREIYWNRENGDYDDLKRNDARTVINAGATVSSRLYRVFDVGIFNWDKLRHEIKPEVAYSYIPPVRQDNIFEWDAVRSKYILRSTIPEYIPRLNSLLDPFTSLNASSENALMEQNAVAWSLTNTVTARSKDKTGANKYDDVLRFKLFQVYDMYEATRKMTPRIDPTWPEDKRRPLSDLGMELDLRPHPYLSFAARNKYSVYDGWREMNYDLSLNDWRGDELTFGYRYTIDSIEAINLDLKAVITEKLKGRLIVRMDLFNDQAIENTVGLTYTEQCWSVGVDYTRTHDDERIIFKISLAGLGSLGF